GLAGGDAGQRPLELREGVAQLAAGVEFVAGEFGLDLGGAVVNRHLGGGMFTHAGLVGSGEKSQPANKRPRPTPRRAGSVWVDAFGLVYGWESRSTTIFLARRIAAIVRGRAAGGGRRPSPTR